MVALVTQSFIGAMKAGALPSSSKALSSHSRIKNSAKRYRGTIKENTKHGCVTSKRRVNSFQRHVLWEWRYHISATRQHTISAWFTMFWRTVMRIWPELRVTTSTNAASRSSDPFSTLAETCRSHPSHSITYIGFASRAHIKHFMPNSVWAV